ncbi:MAG: hypothetical protein ACU841_17870 [Gammaproteobacteria bacterium]
MDNKSHLILFYKGDISALTLFCQQADGHICFPPLPKLSMIIPEDEIRPEPVSLRPTKLIEKINAQLQLDDDLLVSEPGFNEQVETPRGIVTVYMARFNLLDPPHKLMAKRSCKMQPLTALIGRPPAEMELLRRAYTQLMEG